MKHIKKNLFPIFLSLFGIFLMGLGIYRGEVSVLLAKAVRICLECIGIG